MNGKEKKREHRRDEQKKQRNVSITEMNGKGKET